jgi:DNA processing protein
MKSINQFPIQTLDQVFIDTYFGNIPQKPKQLFIRGNFPNTDGYVLLTVVGSRNITEYGKAALQKLISELRGYPVIIVSGLALGTDGLAHQYAMEVGLPVIAFPGSGLSEHAIYPRSHYLLAEDILSYGGCLLSELDPDHRGNTFTFPARNRLMAGISRATLVIEATHKSGTRITARLATEYDRDILALPGSIFSENSEGPNELIRMGAIPVTSGREILEALGFTISESQAPMMDLFSQCNSDEILVLQNLSSPMVRGELIRSLSIPIHKANILLSQMEMKGLIKESGGQVRRV